MEPSRFFCTCLFLAAAVSPVLAAADERPLAERARSALAASTAYLHLISTDGGYLWRYSPDLKQRLGEQVATPTQIWVQPPGTPSVGRAFLRAYAVTGEARYLEAARAAALALVRGQLSSGGWDYLVELDPKKRAAWAYRSDKGSAVAPGVENASTYDDENTQSALRFSLAFMAASKAAPDARDAAIRESLDYGLRKLLEAQYPNGAWPQRWSGARAERAAFPVLKASVPVDYPREQAKGSYVAHYTLNDDCQADIIRTLLEAHQHTGRSEYLQAAQRGGDFLLLAQLPEPQPVWAQQYDAAMHPAWARAFEPPSVSSRESADAMEVLLDLYLATGDARYLEALPRAVAWFERSRLAPGLWARLYELSTNRPIYGDRDGRIHYTLEELSEERRTGYAWQGSFGIPATLERVRAISKSPRARRPASQLQTAASPAQRAARAAELEPRVREIIGALDSQGRWLTPSQKKSDGRDPLWIDMAVFVANMMALSDYLEVAPR